MSGVVCAAIYLSCSSTFVGPGSPGTISSRPDASATLAFELSIDKVSLFKLVLVTRTRLGLLQERTTQLSCDWTRTDHITRSISISMHGYNEVSNYTLYKQWQCIIQLLLPIPCWCIKCESYVRIFFRILYAVMHDASPSLFYLCGLVCSLVELEQNSSCAVALSCVMLVRRYISLRSCLRSCGQVLGTPRHKAEN